MRSCIICIIYKTAPKECVIYHNKINIGKNKGEKSKSVLIRFGFRCFCAAFTGNRRFEYHL